MVFSLRIHLRHPVTNGKNGFHTWWYINTPDLFVGNNFPIFPDTDIGRVFIYIQHLAPVGNTHQALYTIGPAALNRLEDPLAFIHRFFGTAIRCYNSFDGKIVKILFAIITTIGIILHAGRIFLQ